MRGRPLYLGEGVRDVGVATEGRRRVAGDFEGDLPRLVRRIAELIGVETRFGYDASTYRDVVERALPRDGRLGGADPDLHRDGQRLAAWQAMRPGVVSHACPRGFAPFHASAERALRALLAAQAGS